MSHGRFERCFTVEEFHRMMEVGILCPDERVELGKPLNRAYFDSFALNETLSVSPEAWPELAFDVFDFLPPAKPRFDQPFQGRD